jgi:hypothetical protein
MIGPGHCGAEGVWDDGRVMEIDRSLRGARAAVFAAVCVGLSASGHVWMSGAAIPVWALLTAVLAVGGAGYALAGRQRGLMPIAGLMLAGELGLHLLFSATQRAADGTMTSMSGMPAGKVITSLPGVILPHPIPAAAWLCGGGKTGLGAAGLSTMSASIARFSAHAPAGMIAVHVVAGLLCAWWLRRGEAALFRLLRAVARFAAPLLAIVWAAAPTVPDLTAAGRDDRRARRPTVSRLLVHAVIRRGPPATPVFCM